jgi:Holliday junction resolvasome RuvABC endonuclease subunit
MPAPEKSLSPETVLKFATSVLVTVGLAMSGWALIEVVSLKEKAARQDVINLKRDQELAQLNQRFDRLMDRLDQIIMRLPK